MVVVFAVVGTLQFHCGDTPRPVVCQKSCFGHLNMFTTIMIVGTAEPLADLPSGAWRASCAARRPLGCGDPGALANAHGFNQPGPPHALAAAAFRTCLHGWCTAHRRASWMRRCTTLNVLLHRLSARNWGQSSRLLVKAPSCTGFANSPGKRPLHFGMSCSSTPLGWRLTARARTQGSQSDNPCGDMASDGVTCGAEVGRALSGMGTAYATPLRSHCLARRCVVAWAVALTVGGKWFSSSGACFVICLRSAHARFRQLGVGPSSSMPKQVHAHLDEVSVVMPPRSP